MGTTFNRTRRDITYDQNGNVWNDESWSVPETIRDERPPPHRSPRSQWRPPLPYARLIETGYPHAPDCSWNGVWWGGNGVWSGNGSGPLRDSYYYDVVPACPLGVIQKAEIKALQKLKNQHVQAGNMLGERAQTARLVTDTLRRLTETVKAVKRLDIQKALDALGVSRRKALNGSSAFDLWLELQYGWKPLLSDVHGACEALQNREKDGAVANVTVKGHGSWTDKVTKLGSDTAGPHYLDYEKRSTVKHDVWVRLDYVKNDLPLSTLAQLGVSNPLSIAWELVPWSFVADWFIPIGDFLDIRDADLGWSFLGGSRSVKSTTTVTGVTGTLRSSYAPWPVFGSATISGRSRQMQFSRYVYSGTPSVGLPSDFTALKTNASGQHIANGIALLASAILGGSRVR